MAEQQTATGQGQGAGTGGGTGTDDKGQQTPKTYTEAEFQAEIDRRVSAAVEKTRAKIEGQLKADKERLENENLAANKKYEELAQKLLKQQQESELRTQLAKALKKAGIDEDEVDVSTLNDPAQIPALIGNLLSKQAKSFESKIEEELNKRLNNPKPPKAGQAAPGAVDFEKMTPQEYAEWRKNNGRALGAM